jgi:hypothetical protein
LRRRTSRRVKALPSYLGNCGIAEPRFSAGFSGAVSGRVSV